MKIQLELTEDEGRDFVLLALLRSRTEAKASEESTEVRRLRDLWKKIHLQLRSAPNV